MKLAVTIGAISLAGVAWMIRSAIAVGFSVFVGPILIAEIAFLAALYALWRGLGGGEHDADTVETARPAARAHAIAEVKPRREARPAAQVGLGQRSLIGRTGG